MIKRRSSFDRLRNLPPVFSVSEFAFENTDLSESAYNMTLKRMVDAGMIQSAGYRLGLFYNLVADPHAPSSHGFEVVKRVYPSAVIIGKQALMEAGWSTQIPDKPDVAVYTGGTPQRIKSITGFNLVNRTKDWYAGLGQYRVKGIS